MHDLPGANTVYTADLVYIVSQDLGLTLSSRSFPLLPLSWNVGRGYLCIPERRRRPFLFTSVESKAGEAWIPLVGMKVRE